MDTDELLQFVDDVLTQEMPPMPEPKKKTTPTKKESRRRRPAKPAVPATPDRDAKIKNVLASISTIIKQTQNGLQKVKTMPDLAGTIEKWGATGSIAEWQPDLTWATLKQQLEQLVQKLNALKERNPQTKSYKHLDEVIKNES